MSVKFTNLNKSFGDHLVLDDISVEIFDGQTTVIVGSSGSGKSTLLRCINLLEIPQNGELELGRERINFSTKFSQTSCYRFASTRAWSFRALISSRT